ncbi:MAG: M48 family metalloprotease [Cellulomonas sp.]
MRIAVYLPLLASLFLAALCRPLAARVSPRTAAPALVLAAALTALASSWAVALLAATLLRVSPPVVERASAQARVLGDPVPNLVALLAALALAIGAYRLAETTYRRRTTLQGLRAMCTSSAASELVVIASSEPHAVAVPARGWARGNIVITSGMLAALDHQERSVLLAHERAHLRRGHYRQQVIVDAAAAVNPLLRPVRDTVAFLLERDADEVAAEQVGSRALAARSLATAALATTAFPKAQALAFERLAVVARVVALQSARPPRRRFVSLGVALLGVVTVLAATDATLAFTRLVEALLPGI